MSWVLQSKKTNKIQLLPSLQQEIKEVEGMKENKHSIIVWLVFLSVILKDQCGEYSRHYHLRLPYYYTIIWMQRDEEASFKSLRIFYWWPQYSLSAILGKLTFHGVPPNSECIRAWSVWHVCTYVCTHMQTHTYTHTQHAHLTHAHIIQFETAV